MKDSLIGHAKINEKTHISKSILIQMQITPNFHPQISQQPIAPGQKTSIICLGNIYFVSLHTILYYCFRLCPSANVRGHAATSACPTANFRGHAAIVAYPSANVRRHAAIVAYPSVNFRRHAAIVAYPTANFRGHAAIVAYPSANVRRYAAIVAYPSMNRRGYLLIAAYPPTNFRGYDSKGTCSPKDVKEHANARNHK